MDDCVFCKIISGKIPSRIIQQNGDLVVFPSDRPLAPTHLLFVPKTHIETFLEAPENLLVLMMSVIKEKVKELDLNKKSYRIMVNGGTAQEVRHLHIHLLGEVVS